MTRGRKRTPVILQMEAAECGAACLAMVAAFHGRHISLEQAREACATSRDGVDAARIVKAAQAMGLEAHGRRLEPADLDALTLPAILHWNFDHFVVLERVGSNGYHIVDPAQGRRTVAAAEFGRSFTGVVLTFKPAADFRASRAQPSTLRKLVHEALQSKDAIAVGVVLGIVEIVPAIALAGAIGVFMDHVVSKGRATWSLWIVLALAAACAAQFAIAALGGRLVAAFRTKVATRIAISGFWHALHLPISFFAHRSAGEIVSRLRLGTDVGGIVSGPLARVLPDTIAALGFVAVIAVLAPAIAVAVVVMAIAGAAAMLLLSRQVAVANAALQVAEGSAAGAMMAGFHALKTYRLHGCEHLFLERQSALEDAALDREQRIGLLRSLSSAAPAAFALLTTGIVLGLGALLVMQGQLTLGGMIACQLVAGLLNAPVVALAAAVPQIQEAAGSFARIEDLERHPLAHTFRTDAAPETAQRIGGRFEVEAVRYGFEPGHDLLCDVSFALEPGQILAIMGPSGSGKSTLARIIAGLEPAHGGGVRLCGVALADWPRAELRRVLQYVPQTGAVFSGSLEENVTLWDESLGRADAERALELVGLRQLATARGPGGAAHLSAHAPALSGGELQRLAIARALARNPAVLVLDEATSALDAESDAALFKALRALGLTTIVVTHRLETAARCDGVALLENGRLMLHPSLPEVSAGHETRDAA